MKVAVLILSTLKEPSTRNIEGIKNTYVSLANSLSEQGKLKHEYDFYFYYGDCNKPFDETTVLVDSTKHCYNIAVPIKESIYTTFEKGLEALKQVNDYDFYIRCNISCYLHIPVIDKMLNNLKKDEVYAASLNSYVNDENLYNDLYPRGDFTMFSNYVKNGILKNADKYIDCDKADANRLNVPHVDDCLFGLCIKDFFGNDYYNHLIPLTYNYLPSYKEEEPTAWIMNCFLTRVKTIPPGIGYSGYSWEDNDYRKMDVYKMNLINEKIKATDFSKEKISFSSCLNDNKPIVLIVPKFAKLETFKAYLKEKYSKK